MCAQHGAQEHVHVPRHLGAGTSAREDGLRAASGTGTTAALPVPGPQVGRLPNDQLCLYGSHRGDPYVPICLSGES